MEAHVGWQAVVKGDLGARSSFWNVVMVFGYMKSRAKTASWRHTSSGNRQGATRKNSSCTKCNNLPRFVALSQQGPVIRRRERVREQCVRRVQSRA